MICESFEMYRGSRSTSVCILDSLGGSVLPVPFVGFEFGTVPWLKGSALEQWYLGVTCGLGGRGFSGVTCLEYTVLQHFVCLIENYLRSAQ